MTAAIKSGLILFAHGSRDSQWRDPFDSILRYIQENTPHLSALAFLECMRPSLPEAIEKMVLDGAQQITVIPAFLAVGSHVRQDLPALIAEAQKKYPDVQILTSAAIGDQREIQQAIGRFAIDALNR